MKKVLALTVLVVFLSAVLLLLSHSPVKAGEMKGKEVIVNGKTYFIPDCCDKVSLNCTKAGSKDTRGSDWLSDDSWSDLDGA